MTVDPTIPARPDQSGRHRVRGVRMPGFGRILGTRDEYTVETILARNNHQVVGEDELEAGAR